MPITKAAKKSLKKREKRTKRNSKNKKTFRGLTKEIEVLVSEEKLEEAKKLLPQAYKAIDKAMKNGIIKENTASRKKSRLARITKKK